MFKCCLFKLYRCSNNNKYFKTVFKQSVLTVTNSVGKAVQTVYKQCSNILSILFGKCTNSTQTVFLIMMFKQSITIQTETCL